MQICHERYYRLFVKRLFHVVTIIQHGVGAALGVVRGNFNVPMWMYTDEDVNCTSLCMLNQVVRLVSCSMPCSNSLQRYGHIFTAQGFMLASVKLHISFRIITELWRYTCASLTPSALLNRPVIQPSHPPYVT